MATVTVTVPHHLDTWWPRSVATTPNGTTLTPLAEAVTAAPTQWRLTYAACFGDTGPATSELTRDLGEGRWVTVRLSGRGGDRLITRASSVISTPSLSPTPGETVSEPVFVVKAGAETFRADGIPAFGPTSTQPMLASN